MVRGEVQPGIFGPDPLHRPFGDRFARRVLVDPGAVVVAVNADGREIADPDRRSGGNIGGMRIENRIAALIRAD
jgi:hypothetical protein